MKPAGKKILFLALLLSLIFVVLPYMLIQGIYVFGMMVAVPFAIGLVFALLVSVTERSGSRRMIATSLIPVFLIVFSCIAIAGEGAICLIVMGCWLLVPYYFGILIGHLVQDFIWMRNTVVVLALFTILSASKMSLDYSENSFIRDESEMNISAAKAWEMLNDTVPFGASDNFFFKNGVSYPTRMHIELRNGRRMLLCDYNNGVIGAPIISIEQGKSFSFSFPDSLISMKEKNFYKESNTMHLQQHFEIVYGKFEVIPLTDSTCRIVATTCYKHKFKPEFYMDLWVEYFLHTLHKHVLGAVKENIS
jgi:hypothetical protein